MHSTDVSETVRHNDHLEMLGRVMNIDTVSNLSKDDDSSDSDREDYEVAP